VENSRRAASLAYIFLREEAEIIAKCQQLVQQGIRFGGASLHSIGLSKPEPTGQKHALSSGQTIRTALTAVAHDKSIEHESALNGIYRCGDAGIVDLEKANCRDQKQACVEFGAAETFREGSFVGIETLQADRLVDLAPDRSPPMERRLGTVFLSIPDGLSKATQAPPGRAGQLWTERT